MPTQQNLHCIVRIDVDEPKKQHCWEVKIIRPRNSFHRSFSDSKYGGNEEALEAAIKCRDEELKTRPAMNSYEQAIKPKKTNRSGIVGVRWGEKVVSRGNKEWTYPAWIVTGTPESGGKTKTKHFVADVYGGKKKAFAAAVSQRNAWEMSLKASVEAKLKSSTS
jgi:hypothetical protein